jgi:hypothetical protein
MSLPCHRDREPVLGFDEVIVTVVAALGQAAAVYLNSIRTWCFPAGIGSRAVTMKCSTPRKL